MIFYHISTDIQKDGVFYPRQPGVFLENEIGMERICVAPSIADCLTAIPYGGWRLDQLVSNQEGLFKVFRIDTEKLSISDSAVFSADTLFQNGWVPDAEWTKEHWITEAFTVPEEDSFIMVLQDWEQEICRMIPYEIYQLADKDYGGDFLTAYKAIHGEEAWAVHRIKDIRYSQDAVQENERLEIFIECLDTHDQIERLARDIPGLELEMEDDGIWVKKGELTMEMLAMCITGNEQALERIKQASHSTLVEQAIA